LFWRTLAARLALDPKYVFRRHEDTGTTCGAKRKLLRQRDPFDARLEDPLEARALRKISTRAWTRPPGMFAGLENLWPLAIRRLVPARRNAAI